MSEEKSDPPLYDEKLINEPVSRGELYLLLSPLRNASFAVEAAMNRMLAGQRDGAANILHELRSEIVEANRRLNTMVRVTGLEMSSLDFESQSELRASTSLIPENRYSLPLSTGLAFRRAVRMPWEPEDDSEDEGQQTQQITRSDD